MDAGVGHKDRVVVILSRIPFPLDKGDKLRAWHQLKTLCTEFEVLLICLNENGTPTPRQEKGLKELNCQIEILPLSKIRRGVQLFRALFNGDPFQVAYFYQKPAVKRVRQLIEGFLPKHIYCQLVRTAKYAEAFGVVPSTLDYMDALSAGMTRRYVESKRLYKFLFKTEADRLHRYEHQCFSMFNNKIIITKNDLNLIDHPDHNEIKIIANGVDFDFFNTPREPLPHTVLFTGNMSYPPNIKAAVFLVREVLPHILQHYPKMKLILAGANPASEVKCLASKNVEVTGWVNDMRMQYSRAHVFAAPMFIGTGLQNKLLEAMAMKVPVITTSLANDALKAKHREEVVIADTAMEMGEAIVELFENQDFTDKVAEAGQAFVINKYSWSANNKMLVDLLRH